ncbi:META domain-containing protein [Kribbella sp. NPDC051952]|uniref:META domain-containing protein n=1 Tax=Kribbella sp. NPDC051952 TaxID=3154851 RepID=UPI003424CF1D
MRLLGMVVIGVALALTACDSEPSGAENSSVRGSTSTTEPSSTTPVALPDVALEGTKWVVESVVSGSSVEDFARAGSAYLIIKKDKVTGSTGCNEFSGLAVRDGSTVGLGLVTMTLVGCMGDTARLEQAVITNLQTKLTYTITTNRLELRTPNNQSGLNLRAAR